MIKRDYTSILQGSVELGMQVGSLKTSTHQQRRAWLVDVLWQAFGDEQGGEGGVSWVGFYVPDVTDAQSMVLEYCRNKPACSPIGLHGACGQSHAGRQVLVVTDVVKLGDGYIACDPRDRSELVVPMVVSAADGGVQSLGVLDIDSHEVGAFGVEDAEQICSILRSLGLLDAPVSMRVV